MDESDRRKLGLDTRRSVLGDAYVDRALANQTPFTAEFQDLLTRYAWGEIWTRPGLDQRTRRLLVITTMIALGRDEELRMHLRAAAEHGLTRDDIKEVILQAAIYCGIPAANSAFHLASEVFRGLDAAER